MKNNIILLDGNCLTYRYRYTMIEMATLQGKQTGLLMGFASLIKSLLNEFPFTTDIFCVWDADVKPWRSRIYPSYKKGRAERRGKQSDEEKAISAWVKSDGIPEVQEMLRYLGIPSIAHRAMEADDVISLLVRKDPDVNYLIVSTDKDFLQLVTKNIRIQDPIKQVTYFQGKDGKIHSSDKAKAIEHNGKTLLLKKAIVGDVSDSIVGIPGIGNERVKKIISDPWEENETLPQYFEKMSPEWSKNPYGSRVLEQKSIVYRNVLLMGLIAPYSNLCKKYVKSSDAKIADEVYKILFTEINRARKEKLFPKNIYADPSPFLRYFRRLEFSWAFNPAEFRTFQEKLSQLTINK